MNSRLALVVRKRCSRTICHHWNDAPISARTNVARQAPGFSIACSTIITKRSITSRSARALLGLATKPSTAAVPLTLKELRHSYFIAAKKCHPDTKALSDGGCDDNGNSSNEEQEEDSADEFLQITRAYELLQGEITKDQDLLVSTISASEEEEFRTACVSWLGVQAEIVEECKQSPIFRKWLLGRTDSAYRWMSFFQQHGGLAPKLRPNGGLISAGTGDGARAPSHTTRRKRK